MEGSFRFCFCFIVCSLFVFYFRLAKPNTSINRRKTHSVLPSNGPYLRQLLGNLKKREQIRIESKSRFSMNKTSHVDAKD